MPLHIAIDARRIRDFGPGTYIRNLIRSLAKIDRENRYTLVRAPGDDPVFEQLPENFDSAIYSKPERTYPAQIRYSIFLKRLGADVYHIPINILPLWMPKPYIVTTHDVGDLLFSSRRGVRDNYQLHRLPRGLLRADF